MSDKSKRCFLCALTPELIDNIISHLDSVSALGNFIVTCRLIHGHFKGREILTIQRTICDELGPVWKDARFLNLFPMANPGDNIEERNVYRDGIHTMSELYMGILKDDGSEFNPNWDELTQLCQTLHQMNFLIDTYIKVQMRWFGGEGPAAAPLSRTERLRVLRAFYRRQIICNAWAPTRREASWATDDVAAISNTCKRPDIRLGLFAAFQPWELQQVDHVDWFVSNMCVSLCLAAERASQAIGEDEFGDMFSCAKRLTQYIHEHPDIADAALHIALSLLQRDSREALDVAQAYKPFQDRYLLLCLDNAWQSFRAVHFPDPTRDRIGPQLQQYQTTEENPTEAEAVEQESGQGDDGREEAKVEFIGDAVDSPPFGWVYALNERYVNWFGTGLANTWRTPCNKQEEEDYFARYYVLRAWRGIGFALWDKKRMMALQDMNRLGIVRAGWAVD